MLSVEYCSKKWQKRDCREHKVIFDATKKLSTQSDRRNGEGGGTDPGVFPAHPTPNEKQKISRIIGRKRTIKGRLNGKESDIIMGSHLWVSVISATQLQKHCPGALIKDIQDLLGIELEIVTANGTEFPTLVGQLQILKLAKDHHYRQSRFLFSLLQCHWTAQLLAITFLRHW